MGVKPHHPQRDFHHIGGFVHHHGLFQGYYWFQYYGRRPDERDMYRDHPYYDATVRFCADWDQNCFDPGYDWLPLEHFAPAVEEVFTREPTFR